MTAGRVDAAQSVCNADARGAMPTVVSGAVVGRILEATRHPDADRLWIVQVDIGQSKLTIVHGGTRLSPGDLVPVAPPGAMLSTGKRMRTRTYRGQRSEGMLCSTNELGWTESGPDEVAVLSDLAPGCPLRTGGTAMLTVTHTRTHVEVTFADPYLTCEQCGAWVDSWHNPDQCGCGDEGWQNLPCEHQAGVTTVCPSWGPVDGCTCQAVLGEVPHGQPPTGISGVRGGSDSGNRGGTDSGN